MNYTLESFIIAFLITNVIEFFPLHFLIKKSTNLKLKALLITNAITLPIVWLVFPLFFDIYIAGFIVIESAVIIAETYLLKILLKENLGRAFIASLAMNALSALIGLFL